MRRPAYRLHILSRTRHRGVFKHGALALSLGRHFGKEWSATPSNTSVQTVQAPDFSATINLNSILADAHEMKAVPFSIRTTSHLVAVSSAPVTLLAQIALPSDVGGKDVTKFLF